MAEMSKKRQMVQSLLSEIYNRYQFQKQFDSSTEASCLSDGIHGQAYHSGLDEADPQKNKKLQHSFLQSAEMDELQSLKNILDERISVMSTKLVRQLKQRNRLRDKHKRYCDTITAVLQAVSPKRKIDAKLRFNMEPHPGDDGFKQWCDALRAIIRLPNGLPSCWRKRVWLCLAEGYLNRKHPDWKESLQHVFSDQVCPSDESLGNQIVKDLHRTGYASISPGSKHEDRLLLKRVLLAYARWNQGVGYCQGFNVLAALLLQVTSSDDEAAFKIMVYLIDGVLPENYFANNLQALSVDMAVFRDILKYRLPQLSRHLDVLQKEANENPKGSSYEPPLTNVFTMQWFLTLFATCLPSDIVLRIWDSVMLDGNEFLLRVALAVWAKLGEKIGETQSADEFYCVMSEMMQKALHGKLVQTDELIRMSYKIAAFPFPHLVQLREKYTYNITPFAAENEEAKASSERQVETEGENQDLEEYDPPFFCFTGLVSTVPPPTMHQKKGQMKQNLELATNDRFTESQKSQRTNSMMSERMSTDIAALKHQYMTIRSRQLRAHLVYAKPIEAKPHQDKIRFMLPPKHNKMPVMVNHLLLGRKEANSGSPTLKPVQVQEKRSKRRPRATPSGGTDKKNNSLIIKSPD
uniref:TBC1 domain family member 30-like n=1 Tax=Phallusia mammillata TaxID=59560 RepID=A0A6F9DUM5_9ASCI|nr:TBC1 domain family member 30-like [Phallusia mammillata]